MIGSRALAGVAAACLVLPVVGAASSAAGAPSPERSDRVEIAPPAQRVYMVTDSVGLGAKQALPAAFPPGWSITIDGDAGEFVETLESRLVRPRIAGAPSTIGDHAVVAGGYNYPYWDPGRFDRSIDSMVNTLTAAGVDHVYWVTLRDVRQQDVSPSGWRQVQPYYWYFPTVNQHLERALDRHPNLTLIDWAAAAYRNDITYDAIHLNTLGARLYSELVRNTIDATTTSVGESSITRVPIPNADGVEAVAVNLTSVGPRRNGYFTAFDCEGDVPLVSNHNYRRGEVVAHSAIVPVGPTGDICVFARSASNLIVDVTGRFSGAATITSSAPRRLVDTRNRPGGRPQPPSTPLVVDVGRTGAPVALSVTAVGATGSGWTRAAPCGSSNVTSNLNMHDAAPVPNVVVVMPDATGRVCVTASVTTHLIVDEFVRFGTGSGVTAAAPRRVLDTRSTGGRVRAGGIVKLSGDQLGVRGGTTGVMLNLTATGAIGPGYLSAFPCLLGKPATSSLNFRAGRSVANFAIIEPDANGDVCVYARTATHVVVDLMGTTTSTATGGFVGGRPERLLDTRD